MPRDVIFPPGEVDTPLECGEISWGCAVISTSHEKKFLNKCAVKDRQIPCAHDNVHTQDLLVHISAERLSVGSMA